MGEKGTKITFATKTTCDEDPKEFVREFLREKCVDEEFINDILKYGLVDTCVRALLGEGLTNEEIQIVENALKEKTNSDCDCSIISESTVSSKHLDAEYLKDQFNEVLSAGLCEIIKKKPLDPIEYLGHWLIHYKNCQEREKRRKEFEEELLEERLKWQEANKIVCPMFKELIKVHHYTGTGEEEEGFEEEHH